MKITTSSARLKEAMDINGLRQTDLISKCRPYERKTGTKIYSSILSQYISGKREIGRDKLIILAQILDVSESWLAGYDVPMERDKDQMISDSAEILAEAVGDDELISRIQKIQQLEPQDRSKVYGYIDAIYEVSISLDDADDE